MNVGIFGGTFDPIHNGHLLLAEQCREQCQLEEVWFVPANIPPHKSTDGITNGGTRLEMIRLAIAGMPEFKASSIELDKGDVSWTVETLTRIKEQQPDDELFFIIGGDSLRDLPTWREPGRISQLATIVAVGRGGLTQSTEELIGKLDQSIQDRIRLVEMPTVQFSASEIRTNLRNNKSVRFQIPRAVEQYVLEHRIYS